jgi:hypothetical protein
MHSVNRTRKYIPTEIHEHTYQLYCYRASVHLIFIIIAGADPGGGGGGGGGGGRTRRAPPLKLEKK